MICQVCKKRPAVIFLNKMEAGKMSQLALCPICALKQEDGLKMMLMQGGMNQEQIDQMEQQLKGLLGGMDTEALENSLDELGDSFDTLNEAMEGMEGMDGFDPQNLMNMFTNAAPQGSEDDEGLMPQAAPGENLKAEEKEEKDAPVSPVEPEPEKNSNDPKKQAQRPGAPMFRPLGAIPFGNFMNGLSNMFGGQNMKNAEGTSGNDKKNPGKSGNDKDTPYLARFSTNLTERAAKGEIDNIVGRQKELDRIMQILNRRTKNNPVLLGEPGVGKTAVAEALALRIARHQVPVKLLGKQVRLLDMTGLVAGTQFRGQFEGRMKGIINEVIKQGNVILVIDELHNIVGAGDAQNSMNAANILKPALAKGEIQIIGTTTLDEYRKYIEKDSALERRFQPVMVEEPSIEETVEILKGIRPHYEKFHSVSLSDEVLEAAAMLSSRYIQQRFLPDKAIDLIDEAAAKVNLNNENLVKLEMLKAKLADVIERKEKAAAKDNFEEAANARSEELRLEKEIENTEILCTNMPVTKEDVSAVVESWTGIPVHRLTSEESEKLLNLEDRLHKRVIGQEAAVSAVSRAIRRSRCGFRKARKPASFIFAGPTGVGKTELVKALAEELFGTEDALIRVDMSEYMEKYSASKLIGAPPGYVGYDEGGQLSEKVRRHPYSVVLLDEIEKAHPDIFNMLLQILDDGRLTDNQGRTVNFSNTVIIMTTNAGSTLVNRSLGFLNQENTALAQNIQSALKESFRPEFLNRIDDIITFEPLTRPQLRQIVELMLKDIDRAAEGHHMTITVSEEAKDYLADKGYDPLYGARPLRRLIQREVEDRISEAFLRGEIRENSPVAVSLSAEEVPQISVKTAAALLPDHE